MADADNIHSLIDQGSDPYKLLAAQQRAAKKLLDFDGEHYPTDGCAITLSCLLEAAGIDVKDTYRAFDLGNLLRQRGWKDIHIGQQRPGDVGSTCGAHPQHGVDHIYLVLRAYPDGHMLVADNQSHLPHVRYVIGHGKSPTKTFLRAVPEQQQELVS